MRVTSEQLRKIAQDTVAERAKKDRAILSVYLHGSVVNGEPLLGGAADIDLTFIYEAGEARREIVRLNNEVHLDIWHRPKKDYEPARALREQAWLGYEAYGCKTLHDPKHFMDFTQAGVRGLFSQPDNVMARAEPLLKSARQAWLRMSQERTEVGPAQVREYLATLEKTANAVASLNGSPLPVRRFLLDYPARAEAVGEAGLYAGLVGLLGAALMDTSAIKNWLPPWEQAYAAAAKLEKTPAELHRHRQTYYRQGIEAMLDGEHPQAALWPLLWTWTEAVTYLREDAWTGWVEACDELELLGEHFGLKLEGLDVYLDRVEELFDGWKRERGLGV